MTNPVKKSKSALTQQIEEKAVEILAVIRNYPYCGLLKPQKEDLNKLAKHVMSLEIKSRIVELSIVKDIPGKNLYIEDKLKELFCELSELEAV